MIKISAVIITYNEEKNIARCLNSLLGIVEEVVVVDSNSTDGTKSICEKLNARVVNHTFEGHIQQKNYAITQATYPYILSLDADECLDETLKSQIVAIKNNFEASGYCMNRLTNYCGQWIKHSGWYPDTKLRLWDSRKGKWGGINPHDKFEMHDSNSSIIHLKGNILHYSYYTIEEHRERTIRYAKISAKEMHNGGKKISLIMTYVKTLSKFLRNYVLHLGFLDGRNGFMICKFTAIETWLKYKELRCLTKER